jgi:mRNA-degrading endonuclease RelE of RelBE toxin-antitoxin system
VKLRVPGHVADPIRHLHPGIKRKLSSALDQISREPAIGKKLKDELSGLWSLRVGKLRLIYRIGKTGRIDIIAFGPREPIYEETYRLLKRDARAAR